MYFNIGLGNVNSRSELSVVKILNQNLAGITYDYSAPYVVLENTYSKIIAEFGDYIDVWAAISSDVLAPNVNAFVTVTKDEKTVYDINGRSLTDMSVNERYRFKADEFGVYTISYIFIDDNGRSAKYRYTITIVDTEPPVITIPNNLNQYAKVGDVISAPQVLAFDNVDQQITIYATVIVPDLSVYPINGKIKYEKAGVYTIRYTAFDSAGNTASAEYTIKVE